MTEPQRYDDAVGIFDAMPASKVHQGVCHPRVGVLMEDLADPRSKHPHALPEQPGDLERQGG